MKKILSLLLATGMVIGMQQTQAQNTSRTAQKAVQKQAKKTPLAKSESTATDEDDKEPDTSTSSSTEFNCELGNKLTIYQNASDANHIALRWKHRLHRMSRVETSTGANRFENRKLGLIWIGIPTKSILLDGKKGQQLANECRSAQQMAPQTQDMPKG
ncbi:MAG TPA: hypothetical protein VJ577_16605 [Burkholderiaceae bacterium]|nr:hypothetical protein [Burkholderiaceae bacterium]